MMLLLLSRSRSTLAGKHVIERTGRYRFLVLHRRGDERFDISVSVGRVWDET